MSDNLPPGENWKAGVIPKWRPGDGPTAREIDAARADLKQNLHQVIDDMVDGMAAMEKRLAEYEMELAAVRGAGASGIERFTTAHFDVAAISLTTEIIKAISAARFTWSNERQLQDGIEQVLRAAGIPCAREVVLTERDRIDFLCGGVGVEVKIKGAVPSVVAQLQRYAEVESITELVLVTGRTQLTRMPAKLNGKTLRVVKLLGSLL